MELSPAFDDHDCSWEPRDALGVNGFAGLLSLRAFAAREIYIRQILVEHSARLGRTACTLIGASNLLAAHHALEACVSLTGGFTLVSCQPSKPWVQVLGRPWVQPPLSQLITYLDVGPVVDEPPVNIIKRMEGLHLLSAWRSLTQNVGTSSSLLLFSCNPPSTRDLTQVSTSRSIDTFVLLVGFGFLQAVQGKGLLSVAYIEVEGHACTAKCCTEDGVLGLLSLVEVDCPTRGQRNSLRGYWVTGCGAKLLWFKLNFSFRLCLVNSWWRVNPRDSDAAAGDADRTLV